MKRGKKQKTIAIIGGGVSGALLAFHLVRQGVQAHVMVFDPREEMGLGLAYSTPSMRHLLNVPAAKISALPEDAGHFLRWLRKNHDPNAAAWTFAPRAVFGRYIRSLLQPMESAIEHVRVAVVDSRRESQGALLKLEDGSEIHADLVVLATGNFDPAPLRGISEEAADSGVYVHNAWTGAAYENLDRDATVALIGTGLTAVDVLLCLRERGHRGSVIAVSRHGLMPGRHREYSPLAASAISAETPATCLEYLRAFRKALGSTTDWRAVVDSLRSTTNQLWLALPPVEQRRFRRHLQRRWEIVRHRMAPAIADFVNTERSSGTLQVRSGSVQCVAVADGQAQMSVRTTNGEEKFAAARVINCTGPQMDYRRVRSPLLQSLFANGLVTAGTLGTGLRCEPDGAILGVDGHASNFLFTVGPGRLGTLLESIAVPEIRDQAADLAKDLVRRIEESDAALGHVRSFADRSMERIAFTHA